MYEASDNDGQRPAPDQHGRGRHGRHRDGRRGRLRLPGSSNRTLLRPSRSLPASLRAAASADDGYGAQPDLDWRDVDWHSHHHTAEIEGVPIHYVDIGDRDATPVLLVHGLNGVWQNWLDTLPTLAERYRAIALDLPGFGDTPLPEEDPITIGYYARMVDAFLGQLGIDRLAVVGHSMGGFIGAELALPYATRVDRLTLVGAAGISITALRRGPWMTFARVASRQAASQASRARSCRCARGSSTPRSRR